MKATALIESQHRDVEALFKAYEGAKGTEAKAAAFERIAASLVAHDAIERELFYPACGQVLGAHEDILEESLVEHGIVEFCLFRGDQHRKSEELDAYVKALKEAVEHHVEEEEKELLPKVDKKMDATQNEQLGAAMKARFAEAMKTDFRRPLKENLAQVLAGRTRTSKKPSRKRVLAPKVRRGRSSKTSKTSKTSNATKTSKRTQSRTKLGR